MAAENHDIAQDPKRANGCRDTGFTNNGKAGASLAPPRKAQLRQFSAGVTREITKS